MLKSGGKFKKEMLEEGFKEREEEEKTNQDLSKKLSHELKSLLKPLEHRKVEGKYLKNLSLDLEERQYKIESGLYKVQAIADQLNMQILGENKTLN